MRARHISLALVFLCLAAEATTVIPMSIERLTRASTDVVRARAVASWSAWDTSHTRIFTFTRFTRLRSLKGHTASAFVIKQMGGSAGGYTQRVAGIRYFANGEEALLFLHPGEANDGVLVITGLMQGNFRVIRTAGGEPRVSNGVSHVRTYDPSTRRFAAYFGTRMRLSDVEARVQAVQP